MSKSFKCRYCGRSCNSSKICSKCDWRAMVDMTLKNRIGDG